LTVAPRDPFVNAPDLIGRVYAYVAYRIGGGPDAEDVTSEVFERALQYREAYDPKRGEPLAWLLGIARRCVNDAARRPHADGAEPPDASSGEDLEAAAVQRLTVAAAVGRLDDREQHLVALRYGADLTAKQIATVLGLKTNAVEVALHRTLGRLRLQLETTGAEQQASPISESGPRPSAEASPSSGVK
jgi:RNA polymerase sigma-70 factor (ECF subfamily)